MGGQPQGRRPDTTTCGQMRSGPTDTPFQSSCRDAPVRPPFVAGWRIIFPQNMIWVSPAIPKTGQPARCGSPMGLGTDRPTRPRAACECARFQPGHLLSAAVVGHSERTVLRHIRTQATEVAVANSSRICAHRDDGRHQQWSSTTAPTSCQQSPRSLRRLAAVIPFICTFTFSIWAACSRRATRRRAAARSA